MAADPPLKTLSLSAASVADDLGYVALADLVRVMSADPAATYRVIGGHMVTALVARWGLGAELYRETGDTDLGVPPVVVRDHQIVEQLIELGYQQVEGNRFMRRMGDIPARLVSGPTEDPHAVIDVLVPAYTSRPRQSLRVSEQLVTTEVPGLAVAFQRPPVELDLELRRLNGDDVNLTVVFPDEVAALILKAHASRVRSQATDVVDIWRCLEVALAAGLTAADFSTQAAAEASEIVRELFAHREGSGMSALTEEQRLSGVGADARYTRIRALIARVLGSG